MYIIAKYQSFLVRYSEESRSDIGVAHTQRGHNNDFIGYEFAISVSRGTRFTRVRHSELLG